MSMEDAAGAKFRIITRCVAVKGSKETHGAD